MVLLIIPDWRRDYLGHIKHLAHALSVLDDAHIERFMNASPEIVYVFIKNVGMFLL